MARGEISPLEVTREYLKRVDVLDPQLHAFITVSRELAESQARKLEQDLRDRIAPGPLFGVPIAIKDELLTNGVRTTAGSLVYSDNVPNEDAILVQRIREAGGVLIGKTNLPEFAMHPRTWNRLGPECLNPWGTNRVSGGSSGGAACSVAAGLAPLAVGSDGGGSARIPSALCGVCALLPTSGRVVRQGSLSGGSPLLSSDAPIARDVRDLATLLSVIAQPDSRDPYAMTEGPPDYLAGLENDITGVRARWVGESGAVAKIETRVIEVARSAAGKFSDLGVQVSFEPATLAAERWYEVLFTISNSDRYALIGQDLYEDPVSRGLLSVYAAEAFAHSRQISAVEYSRALRGRAYAKQYLTKLLADCDLLLLPTVAVTAPEVAAPLDRRALIGFCFLANLAGFPAATIPCGFVDGLPVGLQLIARPNNETLLLRSCRSFERLEPWSNQVPLLLAEWERGADRNRD